MNFTLKQLQVFLAIVQHRSTLAASAALGISQPAVSSSLSGLESNLGTTLFHRWKKRMIINEQGRSLLPMARRLVENGRELDEMFRSGRDQMSGTIRLGASRTLASYVMPELLAEFAGRHPGVKLEVVSRNKTGIVELIEDFSLDIGVVAGKGNRPEVRSEPWLTDELCVFCAATHPLAVQKRVTEDDLAHARWVLREEGSGTLEVFYNTLPEQIKPLQVTMVLDNIESIKRTVENLGVLSCVSRFAIRREVESGILAILETPFLHLKREYYFLFHQEKESGVLLNYFMKHCFYAGTGESESAEYGTRQ